MSEQRHTPDEQLLEALKAVRDALMGAHGFAAHDTARIEEAFKRAEAAIAKAEGQ